MSENLLPKIEASRKELLDLGMRNTLLNYKTPKARGLTIVQEHPLVVYDILVSQNKAMTFLARPGDEDDDKLFLQPEITESEVQDAYNNTRLQTIDTEQNLQAKILNTYYFAKTSIEEQGVNILYLALGMLNWYEKGNTETMRRAPLLLIPVSLERSSANERFRLRYTGAEIGANLSLQEKMMVDFNITIPDLIDEEEFNLQSYFTDIQDRIKHTDNWEVDTNAIELGFFSFGKFMIYHDLDSSKWPDNRKPFDHPILQSLFGAGFNEQQPSFGEEHHLDEETNADQLLQVVDADSSQLLAMLAVHEGRNMVIQGPPGTGKSQTITNLIADAIGNGKKVLFVAEKMAALEVVKRRLDSVNLGEACLELHSHKANKRELHTELKRILELGKPSTTRLKDEIQSLKPLIAQLNAYCNEVNKTIAQSGHSAQEVMGHLLKINKESNDYKFPRIAVDDIGSWDFPYLRSIENLAEQIQARLSKIGTPKKLLFYGTGLNVFLPKDEEVARELLAEAHKNTKELINLIAIVSGAFNVNPPAGKQTIAELIATVATAANNPGVQSMAITDAAWLDNRADIAEIIDVGNRLKDLHLKYDSLFIPEAWEHNVLEIRQNLIVHGKKWYKFFIGDYKKAVKQLKGLLNTTAPAELETKLEYVNAMMEGKRLNATLSSLEPLAVKLFGNYWRQKRTDWNAIQKAFEYLQSVQAAVKKGDILSNIFKYLEKNEPPALAAQYANDLKSVLNTQGEAMKKLLVHLDLNDRGIRKNSFHEQQNMVEHWAADLPDMHKAVSWNVLKEDIEKEGANYLLKVVENWPEASTHLKTAIQKSWYESLIEQAMLNSPDLRKFERSNHEDIIEKFKRLDILNQYYNIAKVALKHWEAVPRQDGGGQINVLKGEFNRKSRHMPIRKLMQEAGLAIQAIKPVIMMSPMSIANFIPPDSIEFDLVIFDEASQVRPVDALGAILRGKQLVVVGDTKQMPPTSFFDKLNTETEDEENVTADMQSILGMCDAQSAPQRMLRWHYRSRNESLISLSNQEFYENKLIIFPSPGSKNRMGLTFNHLPDTFYDKGKSRTNPKEADSVADAVMHHAIHSPKLSLGVVAFSTAQMQAIQNALEIRRRKNPDVENFFRSHPNEPFFVKNLENVQGDERDVIFISIGYGRTEDGKIPMSFGPLNNEGGERRLNVLITRAKNRCEVFTNITAGDMNLGLNAKFGVRALKSFLYYAQHGKFDSDKKEIEYTPQPFEEIVAEGLREQGYTVREKVGSAGFYIDLAVVNTDHPGRYLLGINCDGRTYHNAKSARDRDRLRNTVLESMGWNLFHVWSTDWFRNPKGELGLLVEAIEKARMQAEHNDVVEEELMEDLKSLVREDNIEQSETFEEYVVATLPSAVSAQELVNYSTARIGNWIAEVVKIESPIHFEQLIRRIADANGVSKIGVRVRSKIENAISYAIHHKLIIRKIDFLWHPENDTPAIRDRSFLNSSSRKLIYIAPQEMNLAIVKVVENSIAIQAESAVPLIAKIFGFSRVTEDMRKSILESIHDALEDEKITKDGDFLKPL